MDFATKLETADVALGAKLASRRDEPAIKAAGEASQIGDQGPLYAISTALLLWGICTRNRRLSETGVTLLAAVAAADAGESLTKRLVKRTRPHVLLDEGRYESEEGGSPQKPEQSFPSGHMAGSVAFGRALSRSYPGAGAACGVASLAMGWSRVAKGAHWPLDVAAGMVVGLVAEVVTTSLLRGTNLLAPAKRTTFVEKLQEKFSRWW
ncbi:MAG: phosphatase PAP2 family protein [Chthoniobacterales bacterium]